MDKNKCPKIWSEVISFFMFLNNSDVKLCKQNKKCIKSANPEINK